MPYKTERLGALLPQAFAANDDATLLHRFLDAAGHELQQADNAVKNLLKSHWINYAQAGALDGLAAIFGVQRRRLPDGSPEPDESFRLLIQATVPSFVGGGTVEAIKGAVRAALGLPYDLSLLATQLADKNGKLNGKAQYLLEGLEKLVSIEEFSPTTEWLVGEAEPQAGGSEVSLDIQFDTVQPEPPSIEWHFAKGAGRKLRLILENTGEGIQTKDLIQSEDPQEQEARVKGFQVEEGHTLILANKAGKLYASVNGVDVSEEFVSLDGSSPATLPSVPQDDSRWTFSAGASGVFDDSHFDQQQSYDAPGFRIDMHWQRYKPLSFEVIVPYFVDKAVQSLISSSEYSNQFPIFMGRSLAAIQQVVDRNRAAGLRGTVQYALNLPRESNEAKSWEDHAANDQQFRGELENSQREILESHEALDVGGMDKDSENHQIDERFAIGGVFGVAVFDGQFGFQ